MKKSTVEQILAAFAEPARLRLVMLLASSKDELSLTDFSLSLQLTRGKTLRHVKALRTVGLMKGQKKGSVIYYRLLNEQRWMPHLLKVVANSPEVEKAFAEDLKRFTRQLPKVIRKRG